MTHHHHHHHGHGHHHHDDEASPAERKPIAVAARFGIAGIVVAAALLAACSVLVTAGDALVISRFGDPVRVLIKPGLRWKLPPPFETTLPVDLRLKTTSSGLQDVGTKDGLRILVQAYVAWKVEADPEHVRQYLRAVRNQPSEAASQIRTFLGSALETTVSSFELASLINTDPARVEIATLEDRIATQLDKQLLDTYGISVQQIGIERLTLPVRPLDATVSRMAAERATAAAAQMAEGQRKAAEITSDAERDSRILLANAAAEAAGIEAKSREQAAGIYSHAFGIDPKLYTLLRSLDTLDRIANPNTRIFLRTDAAPFRVLVEGPQMQASPLPGAPAP
ncbi:membrane protease subunit HflC [Rhizobiales bacterium GAS191]|jgi:membrane protease subunit HflC|nr:membrane protease subunit HflC [Rhizobiales bacterium GAS113]SEE35541.1 membrane protease subunit HflC [Rhizobiales bacterium GAS191]